MFDLEKMALEQKIQVCFTDLTIQDARTGKMQKMTFYRSGKRFPLEVVSKELAEYGFRVVAMGETAYEEGMCSMSQLFGSLIQQETK